MRLKTKLYILLLVILSALNLIYYRQFLIDIWKRLQLSREYVVVSLTTTPHRIDRIAGTIETIFAQSAPIKKIYLSIPHHFKREALEYTVPKWLSDDKRITILRTEDYGPATKVLGVLEKAQLPADAIIVTLDDDVYYPKDLVLNLAYQAKLHPDSAFGTIGADPDPSNLELGLLKKYKPGTAVSILQGYGGVVYRASFFDPTVFDIVAAPKDCFMSDDLYLSFYLAKHKIQRQVFNTDSVKECNIWWDNPIGTSNDALHKLNLGPAAKHKACIAYLRAKDPEVVF